MITVYETLHRNGVIAERARREGRSLTRMERNILFSGKEFARSKGVDRHRINEFEMDGERAHDLVFKKLFLTAVFSYWDDTLEGEKPFASYLVRDSNHPDFPAGGHVDAEQILNAGFKLPRTPSLEEWIADGRIVVRK